jgi:two-component system, OmpR family, sensor histidine kinase KdpD
MMSTRLAQAIPFFDTRDPLTEKTSWLQLLKQSALGSAGVASATWIAYTLHFPLSTVGFFYLLLVVVVSLFYGVWQATFVSLLAVSCLNFFFVPPTWSFAVSDARDWVALISFQICALLVSRLSSRESRIAREANEQRAQMEKLYELSRGILGIDLHHPPGSQLAQLIHRVYATKDIAIFDANLARLDHVGEWPKEQQEVAKAAYLLDVNDDDVATYTIRRLIRMGTTSIGALAIRGDVSPMIVNAIASLAAIAFERHRSYENETRAESAQQAEQLRVAVLDALAHAFKTPLTAIRTASSGLLEMGTLDKTEAELASLIDEESVNLDQLCTRLLQTAKLETASVTLHTEPVIVSKLVKKVIADLAVTLKEHPVQLAIDEQSDPLESDSELLEMILTQYLDNAAKYSAPNAPIDVAVRESDTELVISVRSQGALIEIQDRERVFERFYRSSAAKERAAGAGVGLSIVKKAAEAHHGHVWVVSAEENGTTFFLSIPKIQVGGSQQWALA